MALFSSAVAYFRAPPDGKAAGAAIVDIKTREVQTTNEKTAPPGSTDSKALTTVKETSSSKETFEKAPPTKAAPGGAVPGDLPALAIGLILLGAVLSQRTLLEEEPGQVSTMRVALFAMVSLFAVLTMKAGWGAASVTDLKIDPWWTTLLTAAIAGKAAQRGLERTNEPAATPPTRSPSPPPPPPPPSEPASNG
jgi:hypothetical protein